MNPEFDKEIDSLLRRGARMSAGRGSSAAPGRARESSHLDPDELSAFAEGALPAVARTQVASHLADCDDCRGVVVRLSAAADVAGELEKRAATAPAIQKASWWQTFFSALFAPSVLRYATPVVVLGLIGVVSFIALRERGGVVPETAVQVASDSTRTSETVPTAPSSNNGTIQLNAPAVQSSPESPGDAERREAGVAGKVEAPVITRTESLRKEGEDLKRDGAEDQLAASKAAGPEEAGGGAKLRDRVDATAAAPGASTPPAKAGEADQAKLAREETLKNKAGEVAQQEYQVNRQSEQNRAANQRNQVQMPDGSAKNESRSNTTTSNRGFYGINSAPADRTGERNAAKRSRAPDRSTSDDKDEASDRRSVAGHRFRREGDSWIDVNYKSSMRITGVRRGTDGYRGLIAEFPELGRIAEQLGGEVITVIKGEAYRIR
jgi:hypothetical protein